MTGGFEGWQIRTVRTTRTEPRPAPTVSQGEFIGFVVFVGTSESKGSDRTHHQSRVDLTKSIVVNSQLCHLRGRVIVDEEISPGDEVGQFLLILLCVQGDAPLVGIQIEEEPTLCWIDDPTRKRPTLAG